MTIGIIATLLACQLTGKVVSVYDGDTLTVRTASETIKVRLIHIDSPERGQAFGTKARQNLSDLTFGKEVTLEGSERDRYKRLLAVVKVDGLEVNLEQVKAGYAWAFLEYKPPENYIAAEKKARATKAGLWADKKPIPPWDYRKQGKKKKAA